MLPTASTGSFVAAIASAILYQEGSEELASSFGDKIQVLPEGVLITDLPAERIPHFEAAGLDVMTVGDLSHVKPNLEVAARARKAAASKKPVAKRKTAKDRRNAEIESGRLKYLTSPQAASMVKRLWVQFVEAPDDYSHYATFFRELDSLVGEYRIHTGVEEQAPLELDDDEVEADDVNEDELVASVEESVTAEENLAALERLGAEIAAANDLPTVQAALEQFSLSCSPEERDQLSDLLKPYLSKAA